MTAGTVQLGNGAALGSNANALTVGAGGVVDVHGQSVTQGSVTLNGGQVVGSLGTGTLTLSPTGGATGLAVNINATYANPQNASSAAIQVPTLSLPVGGVFAKPAGNGTPVFTSNISIGGPVTIALADTPGDAAGELTLSGTISGTGSLVQNNAITGTGLTFANQQDYGTLALSGSNTYSGGTTLNFGRTVVTGNNALGTAAVTINIGSGNTSGGTLQLGDSAYTTTSSPLAVGNLTTGITVPQRDQPRRGRQRRLRGPAWSARSVPTR